MIQKNKITVIQHFVNNTIILSKTISKQTLQILEVNHINSIQAINQQNHLGFWNLLCLLCSASLYDIADYDSPLLSILCGS